MYTWKWSTGEAYYKSDRLQIKNERQPEYDTKTNAINQSLEESFLNQDTIFSINETRRENLDAKISDREMIAQRGVNPFIQTSYVNDVVTRDIFLKPINTTFERSTVKSTE